MDRVRAKFTVSNILKDRYDNTVVKLYAVCKGDESSPENESFSSSTPSGNVELYITNPAASEFNPGGAQSLDADQARTAERNP